MRRGHLLNYALYQAGWFACVLGAASHRPWTGFAIALILIGVHLAISDERVFDLWLVGLATVVGTLVEMLQIAAGTYRFTSGTVFDALPPPWLLAMWAQFATTLRYSLRPVMARPTRAALFGAAGGPVAFLAGERLGAVTLLPPITLGVLRLAISWAIALAVFSVLARRQAELSARRGPPTGSAPGQSGSSTAEADRRSVSDRRWS